MRIAVDMLSLEPSCLIVAPLLVHFQVTLHAQICLARLIILSLVHVGPKMRLSDSTVRKRCTVYVHLSELISSSGAWPPLFVLLRSRSQDARLRPT